MNRKRCLCWLVMTAMGGSLHYSLSPCFPLLQQLWSPFNPQCVLHNPDGPAWQTYMPSLLSAHWGAVTWLLKQMGLPWQHYIDQYITQLHTIHRLTSTQCMGVEQMSESNKNGQFPIPSLNYCLRFMLECCPVFEHSSSSCGQKSEIDSDWQIIAHLGFLR